jgi:hypothetical protein
MFVIGVFSLDKPDYVMWSRRYDKAYGFLAQRERELGSKFRKKKVMTKADLACVVDWKFRDEPEKQTRALELVGRNRDEAVESISSQVFSVPNADDMFRRNCLLTLEGVNPVLASIILTFFDPVNYAIFDSHVWKGLLGNPPSGLLTSMNYCTLLLAIRKTAAKHNLDVRVIDKALYRKGMEESNKTKK